MNQNINNTAMLRNIPNLGLHTFPMIHILIDYFSEQFQAHSTCVFRLINYIETLLALWVRV